MGITEAAANYIAVNNLSLAQIVQDTGIDAARLRRGSGAVLSSCEMLELCRYLRIEPEKLLRWHETCADTENDIEK